MRAVKILLSILFITTSFNSYSMQEFNIYNNGLIYNEATMARLELIVDSLNLKFKSCDLNKDYYSYDQGLAMVVEVSSRKQRNLIQEGVSFEDFKSQFRRQIQSEDVWVYKAVNTSTNEIEYSGLPYGWSSQVHFNLNNNRKNNINEGWVMNDAGTRAFYFTGLKKYLIPEKYARLIQYVDCMIDTTTLVYLNETRPQSYPVLDKNSRAGEFMLMARSYPGEPQYPDYEDENFDSLSSVYYPAYRAWDSLRRVDLDEKMTNSSKYRESLEAAKDELIMGGQSNDEIEFYIGRYLDKGAELTLKRSRRVMGSCSQDLSPRYHAMRISTLAAETAKWDVFVRAHLDVMNDKFERISDGSYAYAGRKTYLAELEELGIEAVDLLLGTSLRASNTSKNHYRGYINRIGRALSDAHDKDEVDELLMEMIGSEELDPFNRLLMAYVFSNYNHSLDEAARKMRNETELEKLVAEWPGYIKEVWEQE